MVHKHQWFWRNQSNQSTLDVGKSWQSFSDIEISILEDAYENQQDYVELDNGIIYVKHFLLVNKSDPSEKKSIKRIAYHDSHASRLSIRQILELPIHNDKLKQVQCSISQIDSSQHKTDVHNTTHISARQTAMTESQNYSENMKNEIDSNHLETQQNSNTLFESVQQSLPCTLPLNMGNTEQTTFPFGSNSLAVLSGSASGLTSIGLQNLVKRYTNISLPDSNERFAWTMIEPHFSKGPPRIRLEAVFDIIQQYVDPNLSLLDVLMTDSPAIDHSHDVLAKLAAKYTVITTDFDHLIEDAGRFHIASDPNNIPFRVFCTEEHFKNALHVINNDVSSNLVGLWKIHGTVAMWENQKRILVRADDDGGPIATLKRLSLVRESEERRCLLNHLLETRLFIVINYSATDDFDVTRWLKSVKEPKRVLWIQHMDNVSKPILWSGVDIANDVPSNVHLFDRGLIAIACAWYERGIADRLTVVITSDSVDFLCQITHLDSVSRPYSFDKNESQEEYPLSLPTKWENYVVAGAMLSHLSYFSEAKCYFEYAANISVEGTREYCIARLAAADASIEVGDRMGRIQAMNDAMEAAEVSPLSLSSWSDKKSKLISAKVKRFVEKDGLVIALRELQELLDQYGKPEELHSTQERHVALEAAILLGQLRRYLPSTPAPSDITQIWMQSIPNMGLLQTKGLNLHELALNKYQLATNIEEIDNAILIMKEAIEIREELGHMRGLVASLNVLGSMEMRRFDWSSRHDMKFIMLAAEHFRRSIEYSDKHAAVFDQFQARIHLAVCLFRYPSIADATDELKEIFFYFRRNTTYDVRTQIEVEFCSAMNVFTDSALNLQDMCDLSEQSFKTLTDTYVANNDVRLIRMLAAARFNAELCHCWKHGQFQKDNSELVHDIVTRRVDKATNAYWQMRILRAETHIPLNPYDALQFLLDPLSP